MLKIRTPYNESAVLEKVWLSLDDFNIHATAISTDFGADVIINRQYIEKSCKEYLTFFFLKANLLDSEIFDLRDTALNDRVGLIVPISAFSSRLHPRVNDDYFELVAGAVFWELLTDRQGFSLQPTFSDDGSYEISDFYDENLSVLVVNKNLFPDFNIYKYIPWLFSFGYVLYKPGSSVNLPWKLKDLPKGKELRITPVDQSYLGEDYLETLYTEILPYEQNPLAGFLLQYQIFEMLMHLIFNERVGQIKNEVSQFSGTASDLREIFDPIQKLSGERERIRASIVRSKVDVSLLQNVITPCKALLSAAGKVPRSENFSDLIYDVRNLIFHNYRAIPGNKRLIIGSINEELICIMPKLLVRC